MPIEFYRFLSIIYSQNFGKLDISINVSHFSCLLDLRCYDDLTEINIFQIPAIYVFFLSIKNRDKHKLTYLAEFIEIFNKNSSVISNRLINSRLK